MVDKDVRKHLGYKEGDLSGPRSRRHVTSTADNSLTTCLPLPPTHCYSTKSAAHNVLATAKQARRQDWSLAPAELSVCPLHTSSGTRPSRKGCKHGTHANPLQDVAVLFRVDNNSRSSRLVGANQHTFVPVCIYAYIIILGLARTHGYAAGESSAGASMFVTMFLDCSVPSQGHLRTNKHCFKSHIHKSFYIRAKHTSPNHKEIAGSQLKTQGGQ